MDIEDILEREIDHNFFRVTDAEALAMAREVGNTRLPHPGYEMRVKINGATTWLCRTQVRGKIVWAIHGGQFGKALFDEAVNNTLRKRWW